MNDEYEVECECSWGFSHIAKWSHVYAVDKAFWLVLKKWKLFEFQWPMGTSIFFLTSVLVFANFVPIFGPHKFSIRLLAVFLHYQHYFEVIVKMFTQLLILNYFLLYCSSCIR